MCVCVYGCVCGCVCLSVWGWVCVSVGVILGHICMIFLVAFVFHNGISVLRPLD